MRREGWIALALVSVLAILFMLGRAPAQTIQAQGEEPTKAPYVFPTPIFIPTFPPDPAAPTNTPAAKPTAASTPAPANPAAPNPGSRTYTIVSGDSPWIIAQKMYNDGTKYKLILDANNLTTSSKLKVGSTLTIPPLAGAPPIAPTATVIAPTVAPTLAPTVAPTIATTGTLTTTVPITTTVTATRTNTGLISPGALSFAASAFNTLSVIAFIAALVSAVLALLTYERSRRFAAMGSRKGRLTRRLSR